MLLILLQNICSTFISDFENILSMVRVPANHQKKIKFIKLNGVVREDTNHGHKIRDELAKLGIKIKDEKSRVS